MKRMLPILLIALCLCLVSCDLFAPAQEQSKSTDTAAPATNPQTAESAPQTTPATAETEATEPSAIGLSYLASYGDQTCTVVGIGTCKEPSIVIPETIDGMTVVAIGANAFADCTFITSITLPQTLQTIGAGAFYGCTSLQSMTIPKATAKIEPGAFTACSRLTALTFEQPLGWKTVEDMQSFDLSTPARAAELLRIWNDVTWIRQ